MKVSFSSMNSLSHVLVLTTVTTLTLNHSVGLFATMAQPLVEVASPALMPFGLPDTNISPRSLNGSYAFIVHRLGTGKVIASKSDNPPPTSKSPGGSR